MLEEDAEYEKRRIDPYSSFDPNLYVKFREQPILKSAIEFAREGKYRKRVREIYVRSDTTGIKRSERKKEERRGRKRERERERDKNKRVR